VTSTLGAATFGTVMLRFVAVPENKERIRQRELIASGGGGIGNEQRQLSSVKVNNYQEPLNLIYLLRYIYTYRWV
jgi:hypothetical protein